MTTNRGESAIYKTHFSTSQTLEALYSLFPTKAGTTSTFRYRYQDRCRNRNIPPLPYIVIQPQALCSGYACQNINLTACIPQTLCQPYPSLFLTCTGSCACRLLVYTGCRGDRCECHSNRVVDNAHDTPCSLRQAHIWRTSKVVIDENQLEARGKFLDNRNRFLDLKPDHDSSRSPVHPVRPPWCAPGTPAVGL